MKGRPVPTISPTFALTFALTPHAARNAFAALAIGFFQPAFLPLDAPHLGGQAQAQAVTASTRVTLSTVRPEALSWLWDNADEALLQRANADIRSFQWTQPPASPEHLGYSAGAAFKLQVAWDGALHRVAVAHVDPDQVRALVSSDNFLGSKPHNFVAQQVSVDGQAPFLVLVNYQSTGTNHGDTVVQIQALQARNAAVAQAYLAHLRKTLLGLKPTLMAALNERYFNAVLKQRGFYSVGAVDKKLNVKLTVVQEIRGIDTQMLSWWWDHIGNTERYRLWQPIDHVSFEWALPPITPDLRYDIGAVQRVKEYVGKTALTLSITGADPQVFPPAADIVDPAWFHARADLTLLTGILPPNTLTHQWRPNERGDGVILTSTFVNTALARIINPTFFDDLGSHALREFQMLPYFLPRLYKREHLHQ